MRLTGSSYRIVNGAWPAELQVLALANVDIRKVCKGHEESGTIAEHPEGLRLQST